MSRRYLWDLERACQAFSGHHGPKAIVRYEDVRADTLGAMRRLGDKLGLEIDDRDLAVSVAENAWEAIPEEEKGEDRFRRKGAPGSWRQDLTEEQRQIVETVCRPILDAFYDGPPRLLEAPSEPEPTGRARVLGERIKFDHQTRQR